MKKICTFALLMTITAASTFAQQGVTEKRTAPHTTVQKGNIKITYGQPSKNGRELFGATLPYKKVWAPGADEATQVTFAKDFIVNGRAVVKAGTYSLYIQPDCKTEWTFILNSELKHNVNDDQSRFADHNVVMAAIGTKQLDHVVEQLTFTPREDGFLVEWDQTSAFFNAQFY